ncbi:hypothetical protein BH11PLA1_BH11PLA1_06940 [soil metagenome]
MVGGNDARVGEFPEILTARSLALASVAARGGAAHDAALALREHLALATRLGLGGVTLDATRAGLRARELDRSARREVAALLRRNALTLAAVDAFVPPAHFADPATQERATSAVLAAIELAAELGGLGRSVDHAANVRRTEGAAGAPAIHIATGHGEGARGVVCLELPAPDTGAGASGQSARAALGEAIANIAAAAESAGVALADFGADAAPNPSSSAAALPGAVLTREAMSVRGTGFDPLRLRLRGADPLRSLSTPSRRWNAARFGPMPAGMHDDFALLARALRAGGMTGPVIIDVAGVADSAGAAARVRDEVLGG